MTERKILIPDGDTIKPHQLGVCESALKLRDEILKSEDINFGRILLGCCTRNLLSVRGCLIEILPLNPKKS